MLDKDRILMKIDALKGYLSELNQVMPDNFSDYQKIEIKRSSERLIQLAVESVIDICKLIVVGLRLGVPAEENDLFDKLEKHGVINKKILNTLKEMRGFRNILIHEYTEVDDKVVFKTLSNRLIDFESFIKAILDFIKQKL